MTRTMHRRRIQGNPGKPSGLLELSHPRAYCWGSESRNLRKLQLVLFFEVSVSTTRRAFLSAGAGALVFGLRRSGLPRAAAAESSFEIVKSQAEWQRQLTAEQFAVLREEDTERAWSSRLNKEHRPGIYRCAGCGLAIFSSETKFESGTGWPSFWKALDDSIRTKAEGIEFFYPRTEVHCRRCGGHFGHVFNDGPSPTHLRYCMNGVALKFEPASTATSAR